MTTTKFGRPRRPHALMDYLRQTYGIKTDQLLADALGVSFVTISNIRSSTRAVSADVILRVHDITGLSIKQIKEMV
jgi:plasmid maintenance system antidote protein VapI